MGTQPARIDEASTYSSMLRDPMQVRPTPMLLYYYQPVQAYLRGLGCPENDVEDLTHELLIKLQTSILISYRPDRPFRPYFKAAIRNFYFSHLRGPRPSRPEPDEAAESDGPASDPSDILINGLLDFARQVYDQFAANAAPGLQPGIRLLQTWLMNGARQEDMAKQSGMSTRQVRTYLGRAADTLSDWLSQRLNAGDLDKLADLARAKGVRVDLAVSDIRSLFSHLSKHKRTRALLVLSLIARGDLAALEVSRS